MEDKIMEKIEVFTMEYDELDKLVNNNLFPNKGDNFFQFIDMEEMSNDSEKLFINVSKTLRNDWENDAKEFLKGDDLEYGTFWALTELCRRDLIPEGNYLILVCW